MPESIDPVLIRHLAPKNFLSFGPDFSGIDLLNLNVLIGPNGSGKSNLIEAISFMRAAPKEFGEVTRKGGGVGEWIWKGRPRGLSKVDCILGQPSDPLGISHHVSFDASDSRFTMKDEQVKAHDPSPREPLTKPQVYYDYNAGRPLVATPNNVARVLGNDLAADRSILAQLRDSVAYPALFWLAQNYERIRIYREWTFGRGTVFRVPQRADMRNDRIEEDFSNIGLYLSRLKTRFPAGKKDLLQRLKNLYDGIDDFDVSIEGGAVQVYFLEGNFVIPASRLSDGTLHYLCLLAILCDPEPPPLICIEEPELGLHPDILPGLADLLREAATRTQIIVTTHSDILVDAMTETPEVVVVCEKHEGKTEMAHLSKSELAVWLDKYRLGQLWIDGQLGGKRW